MASKKVTKSTGIGPTDRTLESAHDRLANLQAENDRIVSRTLNAIQESGVCFKGVKDA